ncbi:MAG TPA: hypothetical protein VLF40_04470 [Candidatus Saccharimonadales bacterium]|nr:hypothetical protein [Candidatus Saccharimonadales bacterium]
MKKLSTAITTGIVSVLAAGLVAAPAYAWHPKGKIVKEVQNETVSGAKSDANDISTAVSTSPNDVIMYTVTVSNVGTPADNGDDDMAGVVLTDTLPAGVELVSDPSVRTITEQLGTIKPGEKVVKTYELKVTSHQDGDQITNKACFTGDSIVNDNPQSGCDVAIIVVKNTPKTPTPPELPNTGSTGVTAAAVALVAAAAGYAVNSLRLKRR